MFSPEVLPGEVAPQVVREEVAVPLPDGRTMPGLLARPEGRSGPAVVIVYDIFGRRPFYEGLAERLARAGFCAVLPDFFLQLGPLPEPTLEAAFARRARLDEHQTLRDLSGVVEWMKSRADVQGERVGTVGFCMGGTFVLDLAAMRQDLATVCYYGFPAPNPHATPTWAPAPLDLVDRITGPIIGFWGDADVGVGIHNVRRLDEELRSRGVPFEWFLYPGLDHGFLAAIGFDPNHAAFEHACDTWTRALQFLRDKLMAREAVGV